MLIPGTSSYATGAGHNAGFSSLAPAQLSGGGVSVQEFGPSSCGVMNFNDQNMLLEWVGGLVGRVGYIMAHLRTSSWHLL